MTLQDPRALWALLAIIPIALIQLRGYALGRRDLTRLGQEMTDPSVQTLFLVKSFFGALAFNAFIALAIVALAGPSWGEQPVEEDRENLDVVVAMDISRSMLASDVSPSRLSRGVSVIRSVSRQLSSTRFAVVVFKGDASILLPLTEDLNALETVLDGVSPNLVSTPGSDIERGLSQALDAFPPGTNAHRAVVLVSDGESLTGSPSRVARRSDDEGTPIITLLAGTSAGSTVPAGDGSNILDDEGRPIISTADPLSMQAISDLTGSPALDVDDVNVVTQLIEELEGHVERRDEAGSRLEPVPRHATFLALALVMLATSLAVRVVRWLDLF